MALQVVTRRFDALLDKAGDDFAGGTTSAWTPEEAEEFEQLKVALKYLGDHGSPYDPCTCRPVPFVLTEKGLAEIRPRGPWAWAV